MSKKVFISFIVLILFSPWLWTYARNLPRITSQKNFILPKLSDHVFLTQINDLQNQAREKRAGLLGRAIINKYTWFTKGIFDRYLSSFDTSFLFLTGDIDPYKSTRENGPLLLSFLPLIILGIIIQINSKKPTPLVVLLLTPLPGSLNTLKYESLSRIPLFICLTYFAAVGVAKLYKSDRKWLSLILVLAAYEFARFIHILEVHQ